jgi:hypothetical protein
VRKSSALVLIVALLFVGFVFYSLLGTQPVKVLNSRLVREGRAVAVAGTVENTGRREAAIQLEIHYYDSAGHELAHDTLELRHLKRGQARAFKSPERDVPRVSDFSIYLNQGRNPYGN